MQYHWAQDVMPAWSSDGRNIVFVSRRDGLDNIYVMDADGENVRRLTNHPGRDYDPDWFGTDLAHPVSPAGRYKITWGWLK